MEEAASPAARVEELEERIRKAEAASPAARVEELEERIRKAEAETRVLKLQRAEDAKANEKVVGIFAAHRQSWIAERNRLKLQIQSLLSELRAAEARKDEEEKQRREAEEKLIVTNEVVLQLQERAKMEAEDHSTELWKHKTAFLEMVSSQRQLEADLGRALRQADVAKGEKEEAVAMAEKFRNDAEQKEVILSAMLRKVKIDGAEKQMLLKEVKIAKARKKQAEVDLERWRAMWESNSRGKKGLRLLKGGEGGGSEDWRPESEVKSSERRPRTLLLDYLEAEGRKEHESPLAKGEKVITTFHCLDQFSSNETNDLDDIQHLQDWVRLETEKYVTIVEQRHCKEIEAFIEQLRLKDEKIDSFHWQLLGMEHESNRLQSRIEALDGSLSQLRDENLKLQSMLLYKENELKSSLEQLNFYAQHQPKSNSKATSSVISSESKIMIPRDKLETNIQEMVGQDTNEDTKIMQFDSPLTTASTEFSSPTDHLKDCSIVYVNDSSSEEPIMPEISTEGEEKSTASVTRILNEDIEISKKPVCVERSFSMNNSSWKTDIQALGVSYKIKRLKQQLLVLEKVSGIKAMKQAIIKVDTPDDAKERKIDMNCRQIKGLPAVIAFLNKHVKRYQSLEEKTDDLCKRMNESYRSRTSRDANKDRNKEQTEMLEKFLGETFQLQRYMVATGQKLLEIQSKITSNFAGSEGLDESIGFNMRQFAGIVGNLFTEIQRGLEVRISRVIGDLEGTLACDGILHI